jgi:hypothetical protein
MPNFEVFEGKNGRAVMSAGPTVVIARGGMFRLNREAYKLLGEPAAMEFLYDRAERVIGLRAATPDNPGSYKVRPAYGDSVSLNSIAFLNHYGITVGDNVTARKWLVTVEKGVLLVDLKQEGVEVTRGQGRSRPVPPGDQTNRAVLND